MMMTTCVLLYGDYPALARRVLAPLLPHRDAGRTHLRIGINAIGLETADYLQSVLAADDRVYGSGVNRGKYPLMRDMLYHDPVPTPFVMWFDDDSFIRPQFERHFFTLWNDVLADDRFDLVGAAYWKDFRPGQEDWIRLQPWYTGQPMRTNPFTLNGASLFAPGAWWIARMALLARWDYPWPELYHNGGDVMLGELAYQQAWRIHWHQQQVAINADENGVDSAQPRRGLHTPPIGAKE
jgi:hypothetical protein